MLLREFTLSFPIHDFGSLNTSSYHFSFKKHSNFISCIWIRQVDGADNAASRFTTAFAGVPAGKFRVFKDSEISGLANIDVAGGSC